MAVDLRPIVVGNPEEGLDIIGFSKPDRHRHLKGVVQDHHTKGHRGARDEGYNDPTRKPDLPLDILVLEGFDFLEGVRVDRELELIDAEQNAGYDKWSNYD